MTCRTDSSTSRRRRKPHRQTCSVTGKIRFRDAREATDVLHYLQNQARIAQDAGGVHSIRVRRKYVCRACQGWHLTSWETWRSP